MGTRIDIVIDLFGTFNRGSTTKAIGRLHEAPHCVRDTSSADMIGMLLDPRTTKKWHGKAPICVLKILHIRVLMGRGGDMIFPSYFSHQKLSGRVANFQAPELKFLT